MPYEISPTGHRILVMIMLKRNEGLSFNELRSPPYGINPRTLSYHLRQLRSGGFLEPHRKTVKGGKQYRYTLTTQGKRFLENPISLKDLDEVLVHTIVRILGIDSKIENQLLANDLATAEDKKHRVELSVRLAFSGRTFQVNMNWKTHDQKPVYPENISIRT